MNLVWQRFTLSALPLRDYLASSYLHSSVVGLLSPWRQSSILIQWGDAIAAAAVSLVFGLAPFVPNELTGLLLVACAAFWLLLTVSDEAGARYAFRSNQASQNFLGFTPIHFCILVFWGVGVVATGLSPVKNAAFTDLRNFTLYLVLFALCARVLRIPQIRSWLLLLFLHVSLVVSVYGVRQKLFGAAQLATWVDPESPLSKNTRVYSYLGNPNLLAGYLIPAIVLSLVAIFAWRGLIRKALAFTIFAVNLACLFFTDSRGAFIGFAIAAVVLVVLMRYWYAEKMPQFWRQWLLPIVFGCFFLLFVAALGVSEPFRLRIFSIFAGRGDSSNNFRINVWTAVFQMIRDFPIFGIGPGHNAFNKVYPVYQIPRFSALSAYSILLEVTVEMGFVGLGAFLWFLVVTFNTGVLQLQRLRTIRSIDGFWVIGAIAALAGMLGHGFVDTVWYRPEVNTIWWFLVGLIASYWKPLPQDFVEELYPGDRRGVVN